MDRFRFDKLCAKHFKFFFNLSSLCGYHTTHMVMPGWGGEIRKLLECNAETLTGLVIC